MRVLESCQPFALPHRGIVHGSERAIVRGGNDCIPLIGPLWVSARVRVPAERQTVGIAWLIRRSASVYVDRLKLHDLPQGANQLRSFLARDRKKR